MNADASGPPFPLADIASDAGGALSGSPDLAVTGFSTDTRALRPGTCFVAIRGPRFDGHDFLAEAFRRGAAAALISCRPPAPAPGPLVSVPDTVAALGRIAAAHRDRLRARVVAVTGSNGKTTTKEMIAHILGGRRRVAHAVKSFNNAIGVPLTILSAGPDAEALVVEAGTNHPGELAPLGAIIRPDVAVITNVVPSHLEGFVDEAGVAREKESLLDSLRDSGTAVLNADNSWTAAMARACRRSVVTFGLGHGAEVKASDILWQARAIRFKVGDVAFQLRLLGEWNVMNALAAAAACRACGVELGDAAARLESFVPPPMRMEVREAGGVVWVNDAYNANPASTLAAVAEYGRLKPTGRRVAVLGDMKELGAGSARFHRTAGEALAGIGLDCAVFVGTEVATAASRFRELTKDQVAVREAPDAAAAAAALRQYLKPGDMVLLKGSRSMGLERILEAFA